MSSPSTAFVDHASAPQNRGTMKEPSAVGCADLGGRPPEVIFYLKQTEGRVERAMFEAHGCGYTIACCSVLSELATGKSPQECLGIVPAAIMEELGGLPETRRFCATLAVEALHDAAKRLCVGPAS